MSARIDGFDIARVRLWVPAEVRYSDLDVQGHVNNARYFTFFEQARMRFLDELHEHLHEEQLAAGELPTAAAGDLSFVVVSASAAYRRPIRALAPLAVGLYGARLTHTSIEMHYAVCDQPNGQLYASGATMTACVDARTGRPRALPPWARRGIEAIIGPQATVRTLAR